MNIIQKWLCVGGVVFIQALTLAEPQWLQYKSSRFAAEEFGTGTSLQSFEKIDRPANVKCPEFKGSRQYFVKWRNSFDDKGFRWVVFDKTHKYGLCDIVYVDSNGDGNLNDEKPYKASPEDRYRNIFGPVPVYFKGEDGPITYHLNFIYYYYDDNSTYWGVSAGGWYEGSVQIDGKAVRLRLVDNNTNGTFSDKAENSNCDRIFLGSNANAKECYVGNYLEINDKLYHLKIAKDGAYVDITPAKEVAYGKVSVPSGLTRFTAAGINGLFDKTPVNGEVMLPEGSYRVQEWAITRKDKQDRDWTLSGTYFPSAKNFTIRKEAAISLDIGEPVYSRIESSTSNNQYSFNQSLVGKMGETVNLLRGGSRPDAPQIRIQSKTGDYDRTFKLEYG